jgi:hypothetical protein
MTIALSFQIFVPIEQVATAARPTARENLLKACPASDEGKTCKSRGKSIFNAMRNPAFMGCHWGAEVARNLSKEGPAAVSAQSSGRRL